MPPIPTASAVIGNVVVTPAPATPIAARKTPTGISQDSASLSETAPKIGWMIDELIVTTSSSAPASPNE